MALQGHCLSRKHPGSRHYVALHRLTWERVRRVVLDAAGWRCQRCGKASRLEVHHLQPLELGGAPFDPANLEALCRGCHIAHHRGDKRKPISAAVQAWQELVDEMR